MKRKRFTEEQIIGIADKRFKHGPTPIATRTVSPYRRYVNLRRG